MLLDSVSVPSIIFPNLGIKIGYFPSAITLFGKFSISFYGIIIAAGMILGVFIAVRNAKKTNQHIDDYIDIAIAAIIGGIIGARLYYVLFSLDYYIENPLEIFNVRGGGLAIYGGIIGGFLAAFIVCRVKKIKYLRVLDTVAPGIVLAQAMGRWGNFMNREAFGEYTNSFFAMQIKADEVGGIVTDLMRQNMVNVDGIDYIQVAPTFLYESLWCLAVFIILMIFKKYQKYNGQVLLWYLGGYALGRVWIEGLRTDSLYIGHTNIAISQILSLAIVVAAVIILIYNRIRLAKKTWIPDFEYVLSEGMAGTVTYAEQRIAARKAKKNSEWENYTVENKEQEVSEEQKIPEEQIAQEEGKE